MFPGENISNRQPEKLNIPKKNNSSSSSSSSASLTNTMPAFLNEPLTFKEMHLIAFLSTKFNKKEQKLIANINSSPSDKREALWLYSKRTKG